MKTIICCLAVLLCFSAFGHEGNVKTEKDAPSTMSTGIKVQGLWTIEIFNPDGSLDRAIHFENALVNPALFTSFLASELVPGGMYLEVGNSSNLLNGPCSGPCSVGPSSLNAGSTFNSTDFALTQTGTNFETLRMTGNLTASSTGSIDQVSTWMCICSVQKTVAACTAGPDSCSVVTRKILPSPVAVNLGQIVQITVDITFM